MLSRAGTPRHAFSRQFMHNCNSVKKDTSEESADETNMGYEMDGYIYIILCLEQMCFWTVSIVLDSIKLGYHFLKVGYIPGPYWLFK
jgi:hypothetical protein